MQTVSVAIDDTTVFGPRSIACLSPIPPDFEEIAKNEGQYIYYTLTKTHIPFHIHNNIALILKPGNINIII